MAALRDIKKKNTKKKICEAALKLFEEAGFEKTTMEKIASDAEVGVGTLYNYYPSKTMILFSIIESGAGKYVEELEEVICKKESFIESIFDFYRIYMKSFMTFKKRVWYEFFGEMLFGHFNSAMTQIDMIDKQFTCRLEQLIVAFKEKGEIKETADIKAAVSALYALLGYNIILFVANDKMAEEELMGLLKGQAEFVINALMK